MSHRFLMSLSLGRWLQLLFLAGAALVLPERHALARADLCSAYVRVSAHQADELARSLRRTGSMSDLLQRLEELDQCSVLQRVDALLDLRDDEHLRVHVAILAVSTLGRGVTMESADAIAVATALTERLAFPHERRALMAYITGKLASKLTADPASEPLLAFVHGQSPASGERLVATAATAAVAAGPWARPDRQPVPFYIGNAAHRAIAVIYREAHETDLIWLNDIPISHMLRNFAAAGIGPARNRKARALGKLAIRPDITNMNTREVYEIKPVGLEAAGAAAVARYVTIFAEAGVAVAPGAVNAPGTSGVVSAPAGHFRFYAAQPGVIVYTYHRGAYQPAHAASTTSQPVSAEQPPTGSESSRELVTARPVELEPDLVDDYWRASAAATGLSGAALVVYMLLSTGSRAIPARNAIPAP